MGLTGNSTWSTRRGKRLPAGGLMATKADFTPEEWSAVRDAPYLAAMAVTVAGASGLIGTIKEAFAATSSLVEGTKSQNDLIRAISGREEIKAAQESIRSLVQPQPGTDL